MSTAFDGIQLGRYRTRNRVVMAPMTRSRAYGPEASPTPLMATYYAQRAGAGRGRDREHGDGLGGRQVDGQQHALVRFPPRLAQGAGGAVAEARGALRAIDE